MKTEGIFQFGDFKVDSLSRTLRREEETVALSRRAFDVLLYMVQNPGRVVTHDELLKNIWADTFVGENSLAQSISLLRRALEEKPGDNSYILTLPGRGYQFVSPVKVIASEDLTVVAGVAAAEDGAPKGILLQRETIRTSVITEGTETEKARFSLPPRQNSVAVRTVIVLSIAAALIFGLYGWRQSRRTSPPALTAASGLTGVFPPARRSIAVLGFRNLSGRPEDRWLSTALAEMLTTELLAGEKLRLVSGEDVARAKLEFPLAESDSLSRDTLAELHKDLDSDLVVLGSYTTLGEKVDKRIRLDLRLQDTVAGETIADAAVMGSEADLFDLATQVGARLREKLGVEAVSPVEAVSVRASLPANRDAARFYSEGLDRLRVFDFLEASDLLQRAVAADPQFALAHSALAEAWFPLGYDKKSQQESKQAYALSANLSREEKLVVEGRYRNFNHEYQKAIDVYRTLLALFPDNLEYGLRLARVQVRGGKGHDALATVELLRKLAPPASEDPRIELEETSAWTVLGDFKHQEQSLAQAVEKAKAQGSRLILAEARRQQCSLFRYLRPQDAVSGCREARDIFAAAGDQNDEARSLRTWADVITETDAPEAIRLYQQAQAIFRKNGSQANVADVLNNLGNVYEAQGDAASSEKMLRQALAIYRVLEDKRGLVSTTGNIGDDRMDQGDLPDAIHFYEQQLQLGDPANPYPIYNIGYVRQLQGDLADAKHGYEQALAAWQKAGDLDTSAYAMWGMGNLLLIEADFSGARKMYEQSLALRTTAGDKLTIAETQLGLADLSLEEDRPPAEQEAAVRQALEVFQKQKAHDDEIHAWCTLARTLSAESESKIPAAREAMQHARSLATGSQNPEIRWKTAIAAANIETAEKHSVHSPTETAMRQELAAIISKSRQLGYEGIQIDARLALAEIEIKEGRTAAGRAQLVAVEADAKAKGYNLAARKAAIARN
jgi:DNA-binding winged helix-turn-helix (wHTH) protein/tetratricopeptide (TPR) repeat protein